MIKAENLQRWFDIGDNCVKAVDNVNLNIEKGEFIAVMGPSGSGKSTLLYVLGAMDQPTGGSISIDGRRLDKMNFAIVRLVSFFSRFTFCHGLIWCAMPKCR
jgi:putative ABC transport system ATP-binding protein